MLLTIAFISFLVVLLAMVLAPSDVRAAALTGAADATDAADGFAPALQA